MLFSERLRQLREGNAPSARTKAPKRKTRRTRIVCKEYLAWLHTHHCLVMGNPASEGCAGRIEAHHVHRYGEEKNDFRTLPLCLCHHQDGKQAIGKIGTMEFEIRFVISVDSEIRRLNTLWINETELESERHRRATLVAEAMRISGA